MSEERAPAATPLARRIAFATLALGWVYVSAVFVFGEDILGRHMGVLPWVGVLIVGLGLLHATISLGSRSFMTDGALKSTALTAGAVLVSLLVADLVVSVMQNRAAPVDRETQRMYSARGDSVLWYSEVVPRLYFPSTGYYQAFKHNVKFEGSTYGDAYETEMLGSPTLVDSVLEMRRVDYRIDRWGYRDTIPPAESRFTALGDSFTFGFAIADGLHWVDQIEPMLGEAVYNLGIASTGPIWQVARLRHHFERHGAGENHHVIWMLFEGNDLEERTDALRPAIGTRGTFGKLTQGTVLELAVHVPRLLKSQSIFTRFRQTARARRLPEYREHFTIDGVESPFPLFRSTRLGPRFFNGANVERAMRPASYVQNHPNRSRIEAGFREMKELSERFGFDVTVTVAPTASRQHAPQYEGFPELSERPHFIDFVEGLSDENGFGYVDLLGALAPYAENELLYFRDDHHWNARGNELAARVLANALRGESGPSEADQP